MKQADRGSEDSPVKVGITDRHTSWIFPHRNFKITSFFQIEKRPGRPPHLVDAVLPHGVLDVARLARVVPGAVKLVHLHRHLPQPVQVKRLHKP